MSELDSDDARSVLTVDSDDAPSMLTVEVVSDDDGTVATVGDGDVAVVGAEEDDILLDIWVGDRALKSIRRYVKTMLPAERTFGLAVAPLDDCVWLQDGDLLGYEGGPVTLRAVGTAVSTNFHADLQHFPEYFFAIDLARPIDRDALSYTYAVCAPDKPVPAFLECHARMRQRCASFNDVYRATNGIRAGDMAKRIGYQEVMIGDVVLVETKCRRLAGDIEFELSAIYLVAQAPIEL
ncbi:hypothetical protein OH76DRAFT_1478946 [Lentinus brumalis]|uniref:Uncharacterized protein n=1 Tax=Lentinus brumalis TaxID=2498619 RepID=A0A371DQ80_9APHY|nr:hypothetical protein OH76DRAFT_1478946 [Polyporus brumalis]